MVTGHFFKFNPDTERRFRCDWLQAEHNGPMWFVQRADQDERGDRPSRTGYVVTSTNCSDERTAPTRDEALALVAYEIEVGVPCPVPTERRVMGWHGWDGKS